MLKVENISTGYGKKQVLFDISFEVKQGEIVLLAGSNGSGNRPCSKLFTDCCHNGVMGKYFLTKKTLQGNRQQYFEKKGCYTYHKKTISLRT